MTWNNNIYTCTGFVRLRVYAVIHIHIYIYIYGCVRALSQRDISRTSRPTTWFNSHAFLLCSFSLSLFPPHSLRSQSFFRPPSFRSPSPIFISLAFIVDSVPSFLVPLRRPNPDEWNSHEALAHWGRVVGRLFGNINEPSLNARMLDCSQLLSCYFLVMEKGAIDLEIHSRRQLKMKNYLYLLSSLSFFTNEFAFESFRNCWHCRN